jgi:ABC-type multidrug transport system fused ATPase/permease subunit
MEKMNDLIDTKPTIVDAVDAIPYNAAFMGTSITLNNVHFAYPSRDSDDKISESTSTTTTTINSRPILQGATFTVPQGTTTAIVGSSGCGKSTILRLLYRFYEAKDGTIMIGGYNILDLQKESVQKSIAVIPQDVVLFNETIGYNINYGNLNASMDQVVVAAKQAKIHDIIMSFPAGYDTVVGERGLKLSGGEKQRVRLYDPLRLPYLSAFVIAGEIFSSRYSLFLSLII